MCRTSITYSMWCACVCCRLSLNRSGGQCLDEEGTKVRRWSWSSPSLTPTPLHPVFLSLNKSVGVRVLGREQVFVSFLARGQQAKFSVGTCCAQVKHRFTCLSWRYVHLAVTSICSSAVCAECKDVFFTISADVCVQTVYLSLKALQY